MPFRTQPPVSQFGDSWCPQRHTPKSQILLATEMVFVKDACGTCRLGRALIDSCSQVNFITEDFTQRLRLRRERHSVQIRSIDHSKTDIKYCTTTSIKSRISFFSLFTDLCITPQIAYQPDLVIDVSTWKLPENMPLADEKFYQ